MLEIKHLSKSYVKGQEILHDLNLKVELGDLYGFIGPNGAGKSTTIESVVGILEIQAGEVLIDGMSIKEDPIACKKIMAYVQDSPELYSFLTGIQYLNFICDLYQISQEKRKSQIEKYVERFEMTDKLGDLISSYSHGTKQKLSLISAVIHEPKLLVLDEPFVGLDPKASITLREIMHEICENGGSVFFSTHVLEVAQKLCNKVAIINHGKIVIAGETADLIQNNSLEQLFMEVTEGA